MRARVGGQPPSDCEWGDQSSLAVQPLSLLENGRICKTERGPPERRCSPSPSKVGTLPRCPLRLSGLRHSRFPWQMLQIVSALRPATWEPHRPRLLLLTAHTGRPSGLWLRPSPTMTCLETSAHLTSKASVTAPASLEGHAVGLASVGHPLEILVTVILRPERVGAALDTLHSHTCSWRRGPWLCCHRLSRVGGPFTRNLGGKFR